MKNKIVKCEYHGELYEMKVTSTFMGYWMNVSIRKVVRPNWKIFRTELVDERCFTIDDFETIEDACLAMFDKYVGEFQLLQEREKKINDFYNRKGVLGYLACTSSSVSGKQPMVLPYQ